jgi:hypothetical protein
MVFGPICEPCGPVEAGRMLTFGLSTTFSHPKTGAGGKNYRPDAAISIL